MTSDFIRRQVEGLLEEAAQAIRASDWTLVQNRARNVLALDPENGDAGALMQAAERALGGPATAPIAEPEVPSAFANGRYQVIRFLGEGGKKRVYLAHDTLLDRDVAFALIKTGGLDQEGRERVTREAQAMGKMGTHPHIVAVFDMGEHEGQPYLVTELMAGGDVEGVLGSTDGPHLPIDKAVEIAKQVCRGLDFAHNHGLVHRDLKPGNVWLASDGTAKIGDFGLAVALDRSRLTQAGMMVGTVAYMPPEQAMGGEVSPRSDLYSLGAMLYEMVCGRPPFIGEESVAIITQHLNTPPVAPSWHRPDCPPGLEALILRLLEKDAGKRPASATEVLDALSAVMAGTLREPQGMPVAPADNPLYRRTFVGREPELKQLQATFDAAISGQGALVMVVGEPGIGKTALCEQVATYVTVRGGKALVGHCYEEGSFSLPYLPFVECLRSYVLGREPQALKDELGSGATEIARIVSEVRDRVMVEPREAGDPEDDRWRLYQAVTGFLRNASTVQPLLLVLEDLHWADRGTLDFLVHLSRDLQGTRLVIVGTYRDIEVDRTHPLSATLAELRRSSSSFFARVLLRGLGVEEVQRMLRAISGQEAGWGLAEAVHRQTEGNPLFIQEVVRYLVEEGRDLQGRAATGGQGLTMQIPEGLRDVVGRRLSRLSAECNRVLTIAAVIGRDFGLDILGRMAEETSEDGLASALEDAVRVGVLEEQARPGVVRYHFAHAFFRQTLYEEMIAPRRLRLHQQVARALEEQYSGRVEEHAAELAEHFAHSTDPGDLAKAVRYGEMAADRAAAVYAYGEAAWHLERCLQVQEVLDPRDKVKCCDLLLAWGNVLLPAGEPLRAVEEAAEAALGLAEVLRDPDRCARACAIGIDGLERYGGLLLVSDSALSRNWAERFDQHAPPDTVHRAYADLAMARLHNGRAEYEASWQRISSALDLARRMGDHDALSKILWARFFIPVAPQYEEETRDLALEFANYDTSGLSPRNAGLFHFFRGGVHLAWGDRDRGEAAWRQTAEIADKSRDPNLVIRKAQMEGFLATLDGRLEEAVDAAQRLMGQADELGSPTLGHLLGQGVGLLPWLYLGRPDEPRRIIEEQELGGSALYREVERLLCLAHGGHLDEARQLLHRLTANLADHIESERTPASLAVNVLQAAIMLQERELAQRLVRGLACIPGLCRSRAGVIGTCTGRHLGAATVLLGDPERARTFYRQALEVCQRVRFRPEIALTRLGIAELLLEHYPDERAEANEHLDFALSEFREMKMQPSLERALKHKGLLGA